MPTRQQPGVDLIGPTPRPSTEYARRSLPAELSQVNELVRAAIEDVLATRHESDESIIAAQVRDTVRGKTRNYRGAIGTLGTLLVAALAWSWSQVQAYGDSRASAAKAAVAAEQKAEAAARKAQDTSDLASANAARITAIEAKLDRLIVIAETTQQHTEPGEAEEPPPPPPKRRAR